MNDRRWQAGVGALAIIGGGLAVLVKYGLFPHLSINHDEAVYLQQAELLLAGQLVLYPPVEAAFRPWFFVDAGPVLYPKYTPVPAVLYATAKAVTGTYAAALPVVAGGVVALTASVTAEVFDRRHGLLAGVLLLGSPLYLVHTGVFLPYAPTLLLELGFALCYLRAFRHASRGYATVAGLLIGAAFFARPYTAVLFAAPFIVYTLIRLAATRNRRGLSTHALIVATGGSLGVAVALGYNWVLTGSPLLFPYQAFAPLDGIGFGTRRLLDYQRQYDLVLAVASNLVGLRLYATQWVVGGILGTGLALSGVAVVFADLDRPLDPSTYHRVHGRLLLIGVAASVIIGNLAFWGTLNALGDLNDPNGIATLLGPYYHFDLLLPTTAFAATALLTAGQRLTRTLRGRGQPTRVGTTMVAVVLLVAVAVGGVTVAIADDAYARNAGVTDAYAAAYAPVADHRFDDALVFVPRPYGAWLNHPFQELRNDPGFDGPVVYALRETNSYAVHQTYPDRTLYRYVYRGLWSPMTGAEITAALRPVESVHADRVRIPISLGVPRAYDSVSAVLLAGDTRATYAVGLTGTDATVELVLTPAGARLVGATVSQVGGPATVPIRGTDLTVRIFLDTGTGAGLTYRLDIPTRVTGDRVWVMTPYREACADPRLCGGAAAAIPRTLPPGVFLETELNTSTDASIRTPVRRG